MKSDMEKIKLFHLKTAQGAVARTAGPQETLNWECDAIPPLKS